MRVMMTVDMTAKSVALAVVGALVVVAAQPTASFFGTLLVIKVATILGFM